MKNITGIHKISPHMLRRGRRAAANSGSDTPAAGISAVGISAAGCMAELMSSGAQIAPSLLSADFTRLADEMQRFRASGAKILHLDIMDGHFVPNITFGHTLVKALRPLAPDAIFDVHLMMTDPLDWIDRFCDAGADMITVHAECGNISACIDAIISRGVVAGLSVKPGTPASAVEPFLDRLGLVLVMTVEPGFGGQKMIYECLDKIPQIRKAAGQHKLLISIDGGVNAENCAQAAAAGADILVAGNAVFGAEDMQAAFADLTDRLSRPAEE